MTVCENCGRTMVPYMGRQRFCCRSCSDDWFTEERRQAVEWFRECGMTVQRPEPEEQDRVVEQQQVRRTA